jgi:hypothetical protein
VKTFRIGQNYNSQHKSNTIIFFGSRKTHSRSSTYQAIFFDKETGMIVGTENTKARNRRLRKAEKEKQEDSASMLGRIFNLPTTKQIEAQFGHCPSRRHVEFTGKD